MKHDDRTFIFGGQRQQQATTRGALTQDICKLRFNEWEDATREQAQATRWATRDYKELIEIKLEVCT